MIDRNDIRRLIEWIGEDPDREGLRETPDRFLKALAFSTSGYNQDPAEVFKTFEDGAEYYDQLLVQRKIPFFSTCEHHFLSFFGEISIGYIPTTKIVGLSKFGRVVDIFARRLQCQERLTTQIADSLWENLNPLGVGVIISARHLCMEARGIQKIGTTTISSALRGTIRDQPDCRAEFLSLVYNNGP